MSVDYESYLRECKRIRASNKKLLSLFNLWLKKSGIANKTISNHINNIDFFINECLLYEEPNEPETGVTTINYFLGYWFIRKAMWASESTIKSNSASLKKFYTFMHEIDRVSKHDLDEVKNTISKNMPKWIKTLNKYDDLSNNDMEDIWES